jgi:hypothetical protein
MIGIEKFYIPEVYERMTDLNSQLERNIKKDVNRTFPEELYFQMKNMDV